MTTCSSSRRNQLELKTLPAAVQALTCGRAEPPNRKAVIQPVTTWRPVYSSGLLLLALLAIAGCEKSDPIVTYTVPTEIPPQLRVGKDRILAVMVPQTTQTWFFKITGPESDVDPIESKFREFVTNLAFDVDGPQLEDLPTGWKRAGQRPMRFATINIDTPGKQLELSVSKLARQEDWDAEVQANVNRWRGQIGLPPSDDAWAGAEKIDVAAADRPAAWVDLVGKSAAGGMTPPMASSGTGPLVGNQPMPPDHPPINAAGPSAPPSDQASQPASDRPASDPRLKYDTPDGWRPGRMSSMRMAAFNAGPEDAAAEMTIIPAGGDLRGNVKRWLGQIRSDEISDDELDAELDKATEVKVAGRTGRRYHLIGDEQSIDATIVPLGSGTANGDDENTTPQMNLFIKMTGPKQTVADQADATTTFLESIELNL